MSYPRTAAAITTFFALALPAATAGAMPQHGSYANCDALHRDYPHGVGRSGASDHVRGSTKPVTNFTRNSKVYGQNTRMDRDGDGVACEQR